MELLKFLRDSIENRLTFDVEFCLFAENNKIISVQRTGMLQNLKCSCFVDSYMSVSKRIVILMKNLISVMIIFDKLLSSIKKVWHEKCGNIGIFQWSEQCGKLCFTYTEHEFVVNILWRRHFEGEEKRFVVRWQLLLCIDEWGRKIKSVYASKNYCYGILMKIKYIMK